VRVPSSSPCATLGSSPLLNRSSAENDAGIINAYQAHDSLMAHVDRSELDPHRPLVSVSFVLRSLILVEPWRFQCLPPATSPPRLQSRPVGDLPTWRDNS
jgi:hypothetical protein